jgi:phosphoribosylaminoimidazole-succinocarboxamide synthase
MTAARDRALAIYAAGAELAEKRGIILADTKFEFGVLGGELLLIDEVLTPDSSRFWPKDEYRVGANPPSFDKQFLRDYLESLDWNKTPPPPTIPEQIITQSQARYFDAYRAITGQELRW